MRKKTSLAAAGLLSLVGILAAGTSTASPIVFQTATGATTSGGPVSASASFSLVSPGSLEITLKDTLANPTGVSQLLSGLSFSIPGFTTGTLTNSSSRDVTVATGGGFTLGASGTTTGWILRPGFDLCDICSSGKGANAPEGLIIGPPDSSNLYANANGSIAGNSAHNSFLYETATYDLSISGLTSSNFTVSSVLFRFGTSFGSDTCTTSSCQSTVPEPGALALFAAGLGALGFALSYKRRRAARQR